MEATSRRGQGRRKLASGRRFHSGKRSSLHGPLTFTLQALRKSLSAFDGEAYGAHVQPPDAVAEHDDNAATLGTNQCVIHMADGDALANVVAWLRDICESDPEASLIFPPSLSKEQRAQIHTLVQAVGLGALASVSKGVGDNRHITVVRIGQEDASSQDQLDDLQRHKALWIWKWSRDAGVKVSKDEVAEMVLQGCLTADLQQLWERGRARQKLVIRLCDTIADGSPGDLAELLKAEDSPFTEVLVEGTYDVLTQRGSLHCAARLGRLPQLELLLEAGALVDCLDGNGWTALQVSRQHPEQCEAEGILLRRGARDDAPDALSELE